MQMQAFTERFNDSYFSSVLVLLSLCSPSDVTWFVVSVHVNSIKRMLWRWSETDFLQECLKRIKAKLNASLAIIRKAFIARITTALSSMRPRAMFCRIRHSMTKRLFARPFDPQTAAGTCMGVFEIRCEENFNAPASAHTLPKGVPVLASSGVFDNLQASELLPGQVDNRFIHRMIIPQRQQSGSPIDEGSASWNYTLFR
jgi:hypothetical protein